MKRARDNAGSGRDDHETKQRKKRPRSEPRTWGGEKEAALSHRYGNYDVRAGLPVTQKWGDVRLNGLDPCWFKNASVLDVGCGAGYTTIAVAERFDVASILGVDVDAALISKARENVATRKRELSAMHASSSSNSHVQRVPLSMRVVQKLPSSIAVAAPSGAYSGSSSSSSSFGGMSTSAQNNAAAGSRLDRVAFRHEDFVADATLGHQLQSYDVVICFGLTKWVHLNQGDRGLLTLFRKLYAFLKPGGRLLFAAQPWRSYNEKSRMSQDVHAHYKAIKLKPDGFLDFLTQRVGFKAVGSLPYTKPSGEKRAVHLLLK